MNTPIPMKSRPFEINISLSVNAQLWVDEKPNMKNVPIPATIKPRNSAVTLFAPPVLNLTYPIRGTVIRFFIDIQMGIIRAGKIAGIINHVLSSSIVLSRIPVANNRMYRPINMSTRPS